MFFEVPFVLIISIVACVIVFKIKKIEYIEDKAIPLPELAEILLLELEKINSMDISLRVDAKQHWDDKFNIYLERKRLDTTKNQHPNLKIRAIK